MDYIPIIDLSKISSVSLKKVSETDWISIGKEINSALHNVGFMYLINHGVSSDIVRKGFNSSSKFFNLNHQTKSKYQKDLLISRHGWVQPGQELLHPDSIFELRECFDYVNPKSEPIAEHTEFYTTISSFKEECNDLIKKLLKLLGVGLQLEDSDYFLRSSSHLDKPGVPNESVFSSIYYPPIPNEKEIPEGTVRCAEHTDYEVLTLLFQDDAGGLQVKTTTGSWFPATPIPGAILVNTGDLLEFWTNGYYPATLHRVVIPQKEIEKRISRYSFAYFFAPDSATIVSPLKSEVITSGKNTEDQKQSVTAHDHIITRVKTAYGY